MSVDHPPSTAVTGAGRVAGAMKMRSLQGADRGLCCNNGVWSRDFTRCVAPAAKTAMVSRCANSALDTMAVKT
jgi:hypothetical protein